ncbi:hypothetical protein [Reinekea sp.]|jgi:hypothetical protein|uniref:hypothetical protein n=1 Tax=Reinekea sp. TaxID=1970455 RepID=UPI003988AB14
MDMIRAYADKVASYLPAKLRQETADELFDSLSEQFEELESSPESQKDPVEFIQQLPHPIRMATRIGQDEPMYLIGPGLYLSFIETIKIAALVVAVIHVGLFALGVWSSDELFKPLLQSVLGAPSTFMKALLLIGFIFVILERMGERASWLDKWNARTLLQQNQSRRIPKLEALIELNVSVIMLLWITGAIDLPSMIRHEGVWLTDVSLNISELLVGGIVLLLVLDILLAATKLVQGWWQNGLRIANVTLNLVWIAVLAATLKSEQLLTVVSNPEQAPLDDFMLGVNTGVEIALIIAIVIIGWDVVTHLYHLFAKRVN